MKIPIWATSILGAATCVAVAATEVTEVTGANAPDLLPGGKEADGIVGDFVLRNDRITAVISGNLPRRRANMSTFYGPGNHTPGCLYDLTLRGGKNDQLTIFAPCGQRGDVSWVKTVEGGVETYVSAARGGGIEKRHVYMLEGVRVVVRSTLTNHSGEEREVSLKDDVGRFRQTGRCGHVDWADAIDPADRCGYAFERGGEGAVRKARKKTLAPGESVTVTRAVAVASSPAAAVGELLGWEARKVVFRHREGMAAASGRADPFRDARAAVAWEGAKVPAYPDASGEFILRYPAGMETFRAVSPGWGREVSLVGNPVVVEIPDPPSVDFRISSDGAPIPCKVRFEGIGGTENPDLGPQDRAHGCKDQYHSERGDFSVHVPPGKYRVVVTRGPEFASLARDVELGFGESVKVEGELKRLVQTPGWVSTDFHNHSTPSGDNTCGTGDRLINLAAEHIEFAPTTEHNRLYDWKPHLERLGLAGEIATVPGIELTGRGTHLNCFPLKPDRYRQDGGAPEWNPDPRINALQMRHYQNDEPDRWIQINHPNLTQNFIDRDLDGSFDDGFVHLGKLIDAVEVQNYSGNDILAGQPYRLSSKLGKGGRVNYIREFIWLQLLNQGHDLKAVAVADAHSVYGNGVGGWRTYVKSSTDDPSRIDWREISRNAKKGQMILTNGPFLEVSLRRPGGGDGDDGVIAGGTFRGKRAVLFVKVQGTDWIDIDRVQILTNGAQNPAFNFTVDTHPELFGDRVEKFEMTLPVQFIEDTHLVAVAYGGNSDLSGCFGTSPQSRMHPCAYNNPIFMDIDGDGFQANRDTLGFPLPLGNLTPDRVRQFLAP